MGQLFWLNLTAAGFVPPAMRTRAEKVDRGYLLTGSKMSITNSPIADVFVVWAKNTAENNAICDFVLETGIQGLSAPESTASYL